MNKILWPSPTLENWLNHQWIEKANNYSLSNYFYSNPFEYAVLPNLLKANIYEQLVEFVNDENLNRNVEEYDKEYSTKSSGRIFSPFMCFEALQFFLGKEFRSFLLSLTGNNLKLMRGEVPQIRSYPALSPGIKIHNDSGSPFEYGAFLYINPSWNVNMGGKLAIWKKNINTSQFEKVIEYGPEPNLFIIIRCSNTSWHSVEAMKEKWIRKNIFIQYKIYN